MEVAFIESCDSTQTRILTLLESGEIRAPFMLVSSCQSAGFGSRGNEWQSQKGNLYMSFALSQKCLPADLPLSAVSIYFAYLLAQLLRQKGSKLWVKWPNDFYLCEKKIGGTLTTKKGENIICGIGLNLEFSPDYADVLDIKCDPVVLSKEFSKYLENLPKWKEILSKFEIEFELSKKFSVHIDGKLTSLATATLADDGSVIINNKKVYLAR